MGGGKCIFFWLASKPDVTFVSGSGMQDLAGVYDTSKHPDVLEGRMTPEECLADFAKQWDDENAPDGKITPKEFLEYYKDISASIDRDDYFELMMRNGKLLSMLSTSLHAHYDSKIAPLFLRLLCWDGRCFSLQLGISLVELGPAPIRRAFGCWSFMMTVRRRLKKCKMTWDWTRRTLLKSSHALRLKASMISRRFL